MNVAAWDIGGANIKASNGESLSLTQPFALWKHPSQLEDCLRSIAPRFPSCEAWALTMTGELADCFATKAEGVRHIIESARRAADGLPLVVWTTPGEFAAPDVALDAPILAAASNWNALATWVGRMAPEGPALLVDVGSTTTDIIPLRNGFPDPEGRTDLERLISGELVYSGVRRTPVNTLTTSVTFGRRKCPLAGEYFASTLDVYLLQDDIPEDPADVETASGAPAVKSAAFDRLARMLCGDRSECSDEELQTVAAELALAQRLQLSAAISRVSRRFETPPVAVITSGSGEFLARRALADAGKSLQTAPRFSLSDILGSAHSTSACAYALARLARERRMFESAPHPAAESSSPNA